MKRKLTVFLLCVVVAALLLSTVWADMGPKPSVRITLTHTDGRPCWGTLLARESSTGPASVWDGHTPYQWAEDQREIWQAFVDYRDPDGYHFLQEWWDCSSSGQLNWTYYPPRSFKLLLYYPDTDTFVSSGICERYAFDSYFAADLSDVEAGGGTELTLRRSYDYKWELISLLCRIVITILLELGVAFVFGLGRKPLLKLIAAVNLFTQVGLNVLLNLINYNRGSLAFLFWYLVLEVAVFALEGGVYVRRMHLTADRPMTNRRIIAYAFVANVLSLGAGLWIARYIPGIF